MIRSDAVALRSDGNGAPLPVSQLHEAAFLELLLRGANRVFPLLPKTLPVDHAINRIVAQIGMDHLNVGMEVDGRERT